jgi:hypothetical protein
MRNDFGLNLTPALLVCQQTPSQRATASLKMAIISQNHKIITIFIPDINIDTKNVDEHMTDRHINSN